MSLLQSFTWLENSVMGQTIQGSLWIFPVIEVFHLLGLAVLGGAVLLVDLRLLGWGLTRQPVARLQHDVQPFMIGSIALMFLSGIPLFVSEATKCYYHEAFWYKMSFLLAALIFTFTWQRRVIQTGGQGAGTTGAQKLAAVISVILWSGVGIGGRWIGFS